MEQRPIRKEGQKQSARPAARPNGKRPAKRPPARKQTPPPRPKPKPLTPEQKQRRAEMLRRKQARARRARKRFALSLLVFLTFYILLSAIVFAIFFISFHNVAGNDALYAGFDQTDRKKIRPLRCGRGQSRLWFVRTGVCSGNAARPYAHRRRHIADDRHTRNRRHARLHGRVVARVHQRHAGTAGCAVVFKNGDCYLPAEAVTGYMRLFSSTYDDESRQLVIALADETEGYTLKSQTPEPPVEYPEIESSGTTSGE